MRRFGIAIGLLVVFVCGTSQATRSPRVYPPPRDISDCKFGSADTSRRFIVAGVMDGDTLSNLQFGGQNRSTIVRVNVRSGSGPLTIFLHSENTVIWDFEGAVEEIDSAIIVTRDWQHPPASRGLPERVLKFPNLVGCPWVISSPRSKPSYEENRVDDYFGRSADTIAFQGKPKVLYLPEGDFTVTDGVRNAPTETERDLLIYYPGGFRKLDAKSVVSPVSVLEPEIYPDFAGLVQLESAGAIRKPKRSEIDDVKEGFRQKYSTEEVERTSFSIDYAITREITFPSGLQGAHLQNFLVLPGVPAPSGNAGHGCVVFMDDLRSNNGPHCGGVLRK